MKMLTQEEFIEKAKEIYGELYDYSKSVYVGSKNKIIVTCREHGDFEITPNSFLSRRGCALCGKERVIKNQTLTVDDFIHRANEVHGNTYDYTKSIYTKSSEKLIITCTKHGDFLQTPSMHISGRGCPKCAITTTAEKKRSSTEAFVKKARAIHGEDKYGYELVDYKASTSPVTIICKIHGHFEQRPGLHLMGQGCEKCSEIAVGSLKRTPPAEWVASATTMHNGRYSYNNTKYSIGREKVSITCPIHGDFLQLPSMHLQGQGCPLCAGHGFNASKEGFLYILEVRGIFNFTGFGITNKTKARLSEHRRLLKKNSCFIGREFVLSMPQGSAVIELERQLKNTFKLSSQSSTLCGFKTESTDECFDNVVSYVEGVLNA